MNTALECFCTICGEFAKEPAAIPTCFDCFCQPCIEEFIEVTRKHLENKNRISDKGQAASILPCPNCDDTFRGNIIKGGARSRDDLSASVKPIPNPVDAKETIKLLKICQDRFSVIITKLKKLHKIKMEHFNRLQAQIECVKNSLLDKINKEANTLLLDISKMKNEFDSTINAELGYYKFLNENASNLARGIESLMKVKESAGSYKKCYQRFKKMNLSSNESPISGSLLTKYKLKTQTVETFTILETSSEAFPVSDASIRGHESDIAPFFGQKKWSYRLKDTSKGSSLPQGLCFWPDNECFVVSEKQNGTLLGFYVKYRPEKPFTPIAKQDDFLPTSLVRMDKGSAFTSGRNPNLNLAMIDEHSQKIVIFDTNAKRFDYPISRTFDLLVGLSYYAQNEGSFLVTDQFHKSLQLIDMSGVSLWTLGSRRSSIFADPCRISVDYCRNQILVADKNDLHIFDFNGRPVQKMSSPPNNSTWELQDVSVLSNGSVLVAEGGKGCILRLDPRDGRFQEEILSGDDVMGVKCMDVSSDSHLALACDNGLISVHKIL